MRALVRSTRYTHYNYTHYCMHFNRRKMNAQRLKGEAGQPPAVEAMVPGVIRTGGGSPSGGKRAARLSASTEALSFGAALIVAAPPSSRLAPAMLASQARPPQFFRYPHSFSSRCRGIPVPGRVYPGWSLFGACTFSSQRQSGYSAFTPPMCRGGYGGGKRPVEGGDLPSLYFLERNTGFQNGGIHGGFA